MKKILLFGAGKSATVLIDYLKKLAQNKNWQVTVADSSYKNAKSKIGVSKNVVPYEIDIENETARKELIASADIVISLMPPHLHYLIALDCIAFGKNLLTASYIDEQTKALATKAKEKGILFLYEMGLDPGIDHMSAMQIIHHIKAIGGKITSFKSHCGGLVAPESDDNPWHYKISWNPRNVVMAGKAGATFLKDGNITNIDYENLFNADNLVELPNGEQLSFYPNRDSLSYIDVYGLKGIETFMRTTLRHPEFCTGWKNIIALNLTNENKIYETDGLTIGKFLGIHFDNNGYDFWLNDLLMPKPSMEGEDFMEFLIKSFLARQLSESLGIEPGEEKMMVDEKGQLGVLSIDPRFGASNNPHAKTMNNTKVVLDQIHFLGMGSKILINKGLCSAADVLQFILEKKLALKKTDKDMIVMLHEFEYELNGKTNTLKSVLKVIGNNNTHTAMAKTVGLPLGIAAKLILEGEIKETGLHIPILPSIYKPVLIELEKHNIVFEETNNY